VWQVWINQATQPINANTVIIRALFMSIVHWVFSSRLLHE